MIDPTFNETHSFLSGLLYPELLVKPKKNFVNFIFRNFEVAPFLNAHSQCFKQPLKQLDKDKNEC